MRKVHYNFYSYFLIFNFSFVVFTVAIRICKRSLQSLIMLAYSVDESRLVSFNKSSQYSVSAHSLREIVALAKNSFLLIEYCASLRFAPIDVPERNSCLASIYSCFSSQRCLYRLYTLIANLRLFSRAMLFISASNIHKKEKKEKRGKQEKREKRRWGGVV